MDIPDFPRRHGELPVRRKLCHEMPSWVGVGSRHFVTVNCRERGATVLRTPGIAHALIKSLAIYEDQGRWYPWIAVVMPDHVHMIVTFDVNQGVRRVVSDWKRFHARTAGIEWQSDFFEHRLRNGDEYTEKAEYVRQNPIRKGLVERSEDWPFMWERRERDKG